MARTGAIVVAALGLGLGGCSVPNHMHVTEGVAPQNVDTNVRFRTTYYFRTFDYCWASDEHGGTYRKIVPETDVLYRYRMTGKASALANRIQFESAVMSAAQIDPFGSKLGIYDEKDATEVPKEEGDEAKAAAQKGAQQASGFASPWQTTVPQGSPLSPVTPVEPAAGKAVETKPSEETAAAMLAACKEGKINQGFMIMGPEGMKQFDQSQRLVLAMTSSADPLIATLQEYSGRVLAKSNSSADLVPLVQEGQRTREALAALNAVPAAASIEDIAKTALDAFGKVETAK